MTVELMREFRRVASFFGMAAAFLATLGLQAMEGDPPLPRTAFAACITEWFDWQRETNVSRIHSRWAAYRKIGTESLRLHVAPKGTGLGADTLYFQEIKKEPFRIKLILMNMPPPSSFPLENDKGEKSPVGFSYWHPEARPAIEALTSALVASVVEAGWWDQVDAVIPMMGTAGEALYPHFSYTGQKSQSFWCYDPHAQQHFRQTMKGKYTDLAKANKAWGTEEIFKNWEEVRVLPPGTRPGTYWEDVLLWYRQSKRDFVAWAIDSVQKISRKKQILYIPGHQFSSQAWEEAIKTGSGNEWISVMTDHDFLMDLAGEKNCWIQYTGVENSGSAAYVGNYVRKKGASGLVAFGENAGFHQISNDPMLLAGNIVKHRFAGLDLTFGSHLFEPDGVTPNQNFSKLGEAFQTIKASLGPE